MSYIFICNKLSNLISRVGTMTSKQEILCFSINFGTSSFTSNQMGKLYSQCVCVYEVVQYYIIIELNEKNSRTIMIMRASLFLVAVKIDLVFQ